jgi:tRNA-2-methylthio-N6-dimethylallyladenosine synthase
LNSLNTIKKRRPGMIVGVTGCMAQKEGEKVADRVPIADLIVGTRDLFKIGDLIDEAARSRSKNLVVSISDVDKPVFLQEQPVRRRHGLKALVTVMYGCNNFCSFCIVPKTRGREVSRPRQDVVNEVKQLVAQGFREVQLLGQNVNSYEHNGDDFADLLQAVHDVDGMERIRFITSHPKDCSDKLIRTIADLPKLCTNFHLPVQAGSNRILRKMKRFYTREHYMDLLDRVRSTVAGATISTDVICGFPGETDEDFEETYDLLERCRWDMAFIFGYSPREGTKSAQWIDSIPEETKKHRVHRLIGRQEQISGELNELYTGTIQEVLVEGMSKRRDSEVMGRTQGDKCVIFKGSSDLVGQLVNVNIVGSHAHTLFGAMV